MYYALGVILAAAGTAMPAGMLSIIWDSVSVNMTVDIPYIALIRALLAAGGFLACVLCDRIRRTLRHFEAVCAALALQACTIIGMSLARTTVGLFIWMTLEGFGTGLVTGMLCSLLLVENTGALMGLCAAFPAGCAAGCFILNKVLSLHGSWRTALQILAIAMVVMFLALFILVRSHLSAEKLKELQRVKSRWAFLSDPKAASMHHTMTEKEAEAVSRFFARRVIFAYIAAMALGVLLCALVLWPDAYLAQIPDTSLTDGLSVAIVCAGSAAGLLITGFLSRKKSADHAAYSAGRYRILALCLLFSAAVCVLECVLAIRGQLSVTGVNVLRFLSSACIAPVCALLIQTSDTRLDYDAVSSLTGLIPGCFFIGYMIITPVTQVLVKSGRVAHFPIWLLAVTAIGAVLAAVPGRTGGSK